LTGVKLHSHGGRTATAVAHTNNCEPICLGGIFTMHPTKLQLSGPTYCHARPHEISTRLRFHIVRWSDWGGAVAHGRGRHPIFRPGGGYFRDAVVALLKATDLGRCEGRPAYLRLLIKEPRRPGGPLGPWRSWAGPQTLCKPYGSSFSRPES
jgi:hypothetical protein